MTKADQRKGPKQSKLAAWQSPVPEYVEEVVPEAPKEFDFTLTTEDVPVDPSEEPKVELKKIVKKKTD